MWVLFICKLQFTTYVHAKPNFWNLTDLESVDMIRWITAILYPLFQYPPPLSAMIRREFNKSSETCIFKKNF